jgi:predicted Zn-dependent protease
MIPLSHLQKAASDGLAFTRAQGDVEEAEVFVAANGVLLTRLNYTSHIPCNGVEEPKSVDNFGIGIQAVFKAPDGDARRIGFGSETSDISVTGIQSALDKARAGAVADPEFVSLPRPSRQRHRLTKYHDPAVMDIQDTDLVDVGWRAAGGALRVFETSESLAEIAGHPDRLKELGLIISGDVTILQERMAVASTTMPAVQADESTLIMSFITSMVEREGAKGSGFGASTTLEGFTDEAGRDAARNAIAGIGGVRVPSGDYKIVFGREAVMELLHYLILPGLNTGMFYAAGSPFMGQLGKQVASPNFSLYDDGSAAGLVGSKGVTCEGLPTGRTELIKDGVLVGLLSNHYESQRLRRDPNAREKLGVDPGEWASAFVPRNGFRYARGGGRHFDSQPGIHPTNVIVPGAVESTEAMARLVGDGLYIGRIWYTYPVNGLRAGDFTATVVADSYMIRDGKIAEPIKANALRINDNIRNVLNGVMGVSSEGMPTLVWAADEIVYAPEIAIEKVRMDAIAEYMEAI